jgi:hypothetical protein
MNREHSNILIENAGVRASIVMKYMYKDHNAWDMHGICIPPMSSTLFCEPMKCHEGRVFLVLWQCPCLS